MRCLDLSIYFSPLSSHSKKGIQDGRGFWKKNVSLLVEIKMIFTLPLEEAEI